MHVPDAETRLPLLKRSAFSIVQARSRSSSYCTPQSEQRSLTPLQRSASHSKLDKFLEVSFKATVATLINLCNLQRCLVHCLLED